MSGVHSLEFDGVMRSVSVPEESDVDAVTKLFDQGYVVLLTPKAGRSNHVEASLVEEAASTAGLTTGGQVNVAPQWAATRLMPPKGPRR